MSTAITIFIAALFFASIGTPAVRRAAFKLGLISMPRADRAHTEPTAMLGGVAIYLGATVALLQQYRPKNSFFGTSSRLTSRVIRAATDILWPPGMKPNAFFSFSFSSGVMATSSNSFAVIDAYMSRNFSGVSGR